MGELVSRRTWAHVALVLAVLGSFCGSASAQLAQTITFPPVADRFSYQSPFAIAATATSGLTVSFSSTRDICRVSGTTVTLVSVGTCTIIAEQPGDGTYAAAPLVSRSFQVLADTTPPQTQITLAPQANTKLTSAEFAFAGDDGPGILASLQCSLDAAPFATCTSPVSLWNLAEQSHTFQVRAVDLAGNVDSTPASHTWTVDITPPGPIAIASPAAGSLNAIGPTIAGLGAEANAGIFVEEGATLVCAAQANAAGEWSCNSNLAVGIHQISVYQSDVAGNAGPASTPITITVKKSATITLSSGANPSQGGQALTMTAALAGTPAPTGTVVFRDGGTPIEGCIDVGIASTQARCTTSALTLGDHQITVVYSGDNEYISSTSAALVQTVNGLSQTITFGALTGRTFGAAPFAVSATASSGLTVSFSSLTPGVCTVLGSLVTLAGAGQCTIAADQPGDTQYSPAPRVTQTFEVAKAAQAIAFGPAPSVPEGGSGRVSATGGGSGNPVTFQSLTPAVCTVSGDTVSGLVEGGTCTIAADQAGNANYTAAPQATLSFQIGPKATLTVTPASLEFGGHSINTTSPALAVTITNAGTGNAAISAVTATNPFSVIHACATLAGGASCTASVTFTPASEGAASGTLTIAHGGGTAIVTLAGSGEKSLVAHYYNSILGRAPDAPGKAFWDAEAARVQALGMNVNEVWMAMAQAFYFSPEYIALNRSDTAFVTDLYRTFFNRAPDMAGLDTWTQQLAAGMPREIVLASFLFSPEFGNFTQAVFGNAATRREVDTVGDFYRGLLARLPDNDGLAHWVARFRAAQCSSQAAVAAEADAISSQFTQSAEYANRNRSNGQFVGDLYSSLLRRGGDLAGVQFWINELTSGARTRENVRQAFMGTTEFSARIASIHAQGCAL